MNMIKHKNKKRAGEEETIYMTSGGGDVNRTMAAMAKGEEGGGSAYDDKGF